MKHKTQKLQQLHKEYKCCCYKSNYASYEEALLALLEHSMRVLYSSMTVYKCDMHRKYHHGHDYRMSDTEILDRNMLVANQLKDWDAVHI